MICCIFAVLVFTGCGEEPPEPTSAKTVRKKIPVQKPVQKSVPPPPSDTGQLSARGPTTGTEETKQPEEEKEVDVLKGDGETSGDFDEGVVRKPIEIPEPSEPQAPAVSEKVDSEEKTPEPSMETPEPSMETDEAPQTADNVLAKIPSPDRPEPKPEKEMKETEKEPAPVADGDDAAEEALEEKAEEKVQPEDESPGLDENSLAALIGSPADEKAETEGYHPEGKIDPFEPLFKEEEPEKEDEVVEDPEPDQTVKKKRRIPRTPLEKMDLEQLKLVGVIRAKSGNKALVEEASGKGYIITEGTYIGIHSGRVIDIMKDRIVVEEEYEDPYGKMISRTRELKIQRPPGEG